MFQFYILNVAIPDCQKKIVMLLNGIVFISVARTILSVLI